MYYDATVECFTLEFLVFAAIAVCVLMIFIVFPTVLLIVYPTRLFRRCASCCGFQRWHALHTFVESFQGQYKDGTNGTRDFRIVSAFFLILRILIVASFSLHHWAYLATSEILCAVFIGTCCFYAIMRPYRLNSGNNVDISVLALLAILLLILPIALHQYVYKQVVIVWSMLVSLLLGILHMVLILFLCHKFAKKTGITHCLKTKYGDLKRCVSANRHTIQVQADREAEFNTDSLPDRIIYKPRGV